MAKYSFRDGDLSGALKSIDKALEYSDDRLYQLVRMQFLKDIKTQ
jgi:hypothetical protein